MQGAPFHLSLARGDIVRVQKNPRPHKKSKAEAAWICAFSSAAHYSKMPAPELFNEASVITADTGWYYRDALTAGMFGHLLRSCGGLKITTPTVFLNRSTAESLVSGVAKVMTPDTKLWDNNYFWDEIGHPTRLTFRACGVYLVFAQVNYSATNGQYRTTSIRKNGTTTIVSAREFVSVSGAANPIAFTLFFAEVGDYLEVIAQTNVSGPTGQLQGFWAMAMTPEQVIPQ